MSSSRHVRYEYDGGRIYLKGACGYCLHPFYVSVAGSVAQSCVDHNSCPECLKRFNHVPACRKLSIQQWSLERTCANLGCLKRFRVSGLPRSGKVRFRCRWTTKCAGMTIDVYVMRCGCVDDGVTWVDRLSVHSRTHMCLQSN